MFLQNIIYGTIIGIGFIIPGVSGGVLATILGIYDKIIDKLINFNKDIKNNILYFFPLFSGIFISILFFSKIILYLLDAKTEFISYVFIGLIIGCIPYLFKEIKFKTNKNISIIAFLLAFLIGISLFFIEITPIQNGVIPNIFTMIIGGIFYSIGKIVPGISGAALLMILGIYKYFLSIIANPLSITFNIFISFIPFIISFIISAIFILKLMNYLITNHFRITYSAIIGFVISSILFIFPGNISIINIIISLLSFLISFYLSK